MVIILLFTEKTISGRKKKKTKGQNANFQAKVKKMKGKIEQVEKDSNMGGFVGLALYSHHSHRSLGQKPPKAMPPSPTPPNGGTPSDHRKQ